MKIRNGFVSNSSSSSFLVAFPHYPKSVDDVKRMLFGDKESYNSPYDKVCWTTEEVAEIVFNDMKSQIPNNKNFIRSRIHNLVVDRYREFEIRDENGEWIGFNGEEWDAQNNHEIDTFMHSNPGSYFYCFTYSDNDGALSTAMEHGDLFDALPYLISSNH